MLDMKNNKHKIWLSPFVAVTFIAVAFSGILLLFHLKFAGMHQIHEWGGLLFLFAGGLHLILNWRVLRSYLVKPSALWGALAGVVTIVFAALFPFADHGRNFHNEGRLSGHGYAHERHFR